MYLCNRYTGDEVFFWVKRLQETSVLFLFASIVVIENPGDESTMGNPYKYVVLGIHDGEARMKVSC